MPKLKIPEKLKYHSHFDAVKEAYNEFAQSDVSFTEQQFIGRLNKLFNILDPKIKNINELNVQIKAKYDELKKLIDQNPNVRANSKLDKAPGMVKDLFHSIAKWFRKVTKKPTLADQFEDTLKKVIKEVRLEAKKTNKKDVPTTGGQGDDGTYGKSKHAQRMIKVARVIESAGEAIASGAKSLRKATPNPLQKGKPVRRALESAGKAIASGAKSLRKATPNPLKSIKQAITKRKEKKATRAQSI